MAYINGKEVLFSPHMHFEDRYEQGRDDIVNVLTNGGKSFFQFFYNLTTLERLPYVNTSKGTEFGEMFANCKMLKNVPLIDLSKASTCISMFRNCEALTTIPALNFSNIWNFDSMFGRCYELLYLPEIDTSNGTKFNSMFGYCQKLVTIPKLNLSKGTTLDYMFYDCKALENVTFEGSINYDLSLSSSKNLTVTSLMSAINALYDYSGTATTKTLTIGTTNLTKLTDEQKAIATTKGWSLA